MTQTQYKFVSCLWDKEDVPVDGALLHAVIQRLRTATLSLSLPAYPGGPHPGQPEGKKHGRALRGGYGPGLGVNSLLLLTLYRLEPNCKRG